MGYRHLLNKAKVDSKTVVKSERFAPMNPFPKWIIDQLWLAVAVLLVFALYRAGAWIVTWAANL